MTMPNDNTAALVEALEKLERFADEMDAKDSENGYFAGSTISNAIRSILAAHTPAEYPDELVNRLCGELDISPAAARRSLANLEARGLIEPASPVQAGLGDWAERTVDIGSSAGPEPSIRHVVLHYYTSHDVPLDKALAWTEQYLSVAAAPPAPDLQAQLAKAKVEIERLTSDVSMLRRSIELRERDAVRARETQASTEKLWNDEIAQVSTLTAQLSKLVEAGKPFARIGTGEWVDNTIVGVEIDFTREEAITFNERIDAEGLPIKKAGVDPYAPDAGMHWPKHLLALDSLTLGHFRALRTAHDEITGEANHGNR